MGDRRSPYRRQVAPFSAGVETGAHQYLLRLHSIFTALGADRRLDRRWLARHSAGAHGAVHSTSHRPDRYMNL